MTRYGIERDDFRGEFIDVIPAARIVKVIAPDRFALAEASDDNAVAVTSSGSQSPGDDCRVLWLHRQGRVEIEVADSVSAGDVVFQAAEGRCQGNSGTQRVGIALTSGTVGESVEVIPRR